MYKTGTVHAGIACELVAHAPIKALWRPLRGQGDFPLRGRSTKELGTARHGQRP
jgi:hypothetical protein